MEKKLTHIVGTFAIQAQGSFLNGSTSDTIDGNDSTTPKLLWEFKNKIPYVSAQAWRHWLRETFKEEFPTEPTTPIETTKSSEGEDKKKFTTVKVGVNIDPIKYAEHDIFGYMTTKEGQGKGDVKATIRSSPFQSSILLSIRKTGWEGIDKGFVYPNSVALSFYKETLSELFKEINGNEDNDFYEIIDSNISREDLVNKLIEKLNDLKSKNQNRNKIEKIERAIAKINLTVSSPLPYTTRFYNTNLQGIFGLAYHRLGFFRNAGDREELDKKLVEEYMQKGKIEEIKDDDNLSKKYKIKDIEQHAYKRAKMILKSLSVLRGGAKQAQFGTDVSPKVLILAGMSSGNLIFNDLFDDTREIVSSPNEIYKDSNPEIIESQVIGGVKLKIKTLEQIISDYKDRITTSVYIGIRNGYLSLTNENELLKWVEDYNNATKTNTPTVENNNNSIENKKPTIVLCSPVEAVDKLFEEIKPK